jgi:uncharacterized protein (TIGR00369 family)
MTATIEPRERLRTAMSRVLEVFLSHSGTDDELAAWAAIAEEHADRLELLPPDSVFWGFGSRGVLSVTGMPAVPGAHPRLADSGDTAAAVVTYGREHQGHPGHVHGGVLAATFDDLFGLFQTFAQPSAVTGELTVRYLAPVKVGSTVHYEAEVVQRDGRRLRVGGTGVVDGRTCVAAEALFIVLRDAGGA